MSIEKPNVPYIEKEKIAQDETKIEGQRRRVEIPPEEMELNEVNFLEKYPVSRATYYRAKKEYKKNGRVSIFIGYHKKEINTRKGGGFPEGIDEQELVIEAKSHAIYFLRNYGEDTSSSVVEEVVQEILVRFLEMAGDEAFSSKLYRMTLSQNVVRNYINKEIGYRNKFTDVIIDFNDIIMQGLKPEQQYFVEEVIQQVSDLGDKKILLEYLVFNTTNNEDVQRILDENKLREYFE